MLAVIFGAICLTVEGYNCYDVIIANWSARVGLIIPFESKVALAQKATFLAFAKLPRACSVFDKPDNASAMMMSLSNSRPNVNALLYNREDSRIKPWLTAVIKTIEP